MKCIYIIRHVDYERLGHLTGVLDELGLEYKSISLSAGDDLPVLSNVSGVISMGGPMSAYQIEEYPFITEEMAFLKKVVNNEIPFLGVCLGAQILAQAFGAKVLPADKELGWLALYKLDRAQSDLVLRDMMIPELFQYHYDMFEIPKGAVHLLKTASSPNQAFRMGKNAYGIQFHPETNVDMLERVFVEYQKKLTIGEMELIRENMEERTAKGREFLKDFIQKLFK